MANWAFTEYVIEGPKEVLLRIENAILHPIQPEGADENWEGGVLKALGLTWEERKLDGTGKYMRGFINEEPFWENDDVLRFDAEEAWGTTDFHEVLEENIPEIDVYWYTEETGEYIFVTNDTTGKYFPARYFAELSFNSNYWSDYFITKEEVYKWIADILGVDSITEKDIETFNNSEGDSERKENYINIHQVEIYK